MSKWMISCTLIFTLVSLALLGCAGAPKPQRNDFLEESLINLDYQSIVMVNIRTKNTFSTKYYLDTVALYLEKDGKEMILKSFYSQNTYKFIDNEGCYNTCTLLTLEPGAYKLKFVRGKTLVDTSQGAGFGTGYFQIPLFKDIIIEENKISYLGRINAVLRERKDDEFAAGPATPLIPQANTGISKGTFDITIQDALGMDHNIFVRKYPALADQRIDKHIVTPFDKAHIMPYAPPKTHFRFFN